MYRDEFVHGGAGGYKFSSAQYWRDTFVTVIIVKFVAQMSAAGSGESALRFGQIQRRRIREDRFLRIYR